MSFKKQSPRQKGRPNNFKWFFLVAATAIYVISICTYYMSSKGISLDDYNLEINLLTKDDLDPITIYKREMDLSKVPPKGSPPAQPAERATKEEEQKISLFRTRANYGGSGDKAHLGGFTKADSDGISPHVWRDMMEYVGVKSLLDVGCGRGISTSWFYMQGVQVQCVEGSHDAIEKNLLPSLIEEGTNGNTSKENVIVEHDFTLGPWWPEDTVDAIWCVELLEHVSRMYIPNYMTAFKKAAVVFVTHSTFGGWHHVEVHDDEWWINKFQMYGFVYSHELTNRIRHVGKEESNANIPFPLDKDKTYRPIRVTETMLVFINPQVAARPEHAHLLSEPGCSEFGSTNVQCGENKERSTRLVTEGSKLTVQYRHLEYKEDQHNKWEEYLKKNV